MADRKWAVNPIKLARAVAALGPNATEEGLIAYYRSIAGLVNEEFLPKPEKVEEVKEVETEVVEVKKKKK